MKKMGSCIRKILGVRTRSMTTALAAEAKVFKKRKAGSSTAEDQDAFLLHSSRSLEMVNRRSNRQIASDDFSDYTVQDVTKETWGPSVTQCSKPAVVQFWASWCSPCRIMSPMVARLAGKYNGKLKFFKIDMAKSGDVASEYGVSKIPALLLIKDGEKKDAVIGCASEKELVSRIDKFLGM